MALVEPDGLTDALVSTRYAYTAAVAAAKHWKETHLDAREVLTYLVSYDLAHPRPRDYDRLDFELREMGATRILYFQWMLRSDLSIEELEEIFMRFIEPATDSFIVVQIASGLCAWNKLTVSDNQVRQLLSRTA
jgi:hypothetical protein